MCVSRVCGLNERAPPTTVKPAEKPLAFRYAIEMADAGPGKPVTAVSLGDQMNVVVSAPDLPKTAGVQFDSVSTGQLGKSVHAGAHR